MLELSQSEQLQNLSDPQRVLSKQKEGEALLVKYTNNSIEKYKALRIEAKQDLFFLTNGILGYKKLSPNLHGNLCEWLLLHREFQYREILLPRGHYKSTIVTIGHTIQTILPDDTNSLPWPLQLGTNCRVLIAHETHKAASRFLFTIQQHILDNPLLMALFPEIVPDRRYHKINEHELELPRTEKWPEPTIDTIGVGARAQGRHYNVIKLDDIFGAEARDSKSVRETCIDWFDNVQSLLSSFNDDKIDIIGTRWAKDDVYDHAHKTYEEQLKKYIRPIYEYTVDKKTKKTIEHIIFPEEFSPEKLKILKRNKKIWTAQYLNDPQVGQNEFEPEWIKYYEWDDVVNIAFLDESTEELHYRNIRDDLDICILVDPAVSGPYGYLVTGMDEKKKVFVLKAEQRTFKPHEFMDQLFKDVTRWQARCVGIESVLFSQIFQDWTQREMILRGIRFTVEPLPVSQKQKELRVQGLSNYLSAGQIYVHKSQGELIQQIKDFGSISEYHMLDALAHGPHIWKQPVPKHIRDQFEDDIRSKLPAGYNTTTGYN
jgi:hypothetical protein